MQLVHWLEGNLVDESIVLAGRCDAFLRLKDFGNAVVDWKTRRFKELKSGWKVQWYKKDVRQLAFYVNCVAWEAGEPDGIPPAIVDVNVAINTKEMSPVETRNWSITEQMDAMKAVAAINQIWQDENNFNPTELQIIEDDE